jgi:hypothetical protein
MNHNYNDRALLYSEKYGIVNYRVNKNNMIYYESFQLERNTYKCIVNLDTMKEQRTPLKRYYKNGFNS